MVVSNFADIIKENAVNNGLLPVQVSPGFLDAMFEAIEADPKADFEIDIEQQQIRIPSTGRSESFEINE